ncbi:MAG: hypothetical protein GKR88_12860 [Flavobacteriaceae bacterium]|nr:MAG: hypothetical protein GKR88_12860 [Flavobacteriaceae bacterium]
MKKQQFVLLFLVSFSMVSFAQEIKIEIDTIALLQKKVCENSIKSIAKKYEKQLGIYTKDLYKIEQLERSDKKKKDSLLSALEKNKKANFDKLLSIFKDFEKNESYCSQYLEKDSIKKWFQYQKPFENEEKKEVTYSYFGRGKIIKDTLFDQTTIQGQILNEVLKNKGKDSYIGNIVIPKYNQEFYFYKIPKRRFKEIIKNKERDVATYKLQKVELEIRDGVFIDVKAYIKYLGEVHVFQSVVGVSILNFHKKANKRLLYYRQTEKSKLQSKKSLFGDRFFERVILMGDVFTYHYGIGNNYIPHDLVLKFPELDEKKIPTNKNNSVRYKIKEKTYLDKIVELRAYTDFLSTFGESENGLVQIEGSAKFYVFPFPYRFPRIFPFNLFGLKDTQFQVLPNIHTNVQYSRF